MFTTFLVCFLVITFFFASFNLEQANRSVFFCISQLFLFSNLFLIWSGSSAPVWLTNSPHSDNETQNPSLDRNLSGCNCFHTKRTVLSFLFQALFKLSNSSFLFLMYKNRMLSGSKVHNKYTIPSACLSCG